MSREGFELDLTHARAIPRRLQGPSPRDIRDATVAVWTEPYGGKQFATMPGHRERLGTPLPSKVV